MADDLCEAAFGDADPTGPRKYYRVRYYDPKVARFISEDPLGPVTADGNLYAYVKNNPANFTDPLGLWPDHGNWCGPNWTGGQKEVYDPTHASLYKPPVDALDTACQRHDICYYERRRDFPCDQKARGECMTRCDRELSQQSAASGHGTGSPPYWWMKNNNRPDPGTNESCGCKKKD